jgi:hypothetical protein
VDRTLVWAGVALVAIITGAATFLAAIKADTSVILTVVSVIVVPMLGAFGYSEIKALRQSTDHVRQQTNGNTTQMLDMLREVLNQQKKPPDNPRT